MFIKKLVYTLFIAVVATSIGCAATDATTSDDDGSTDDGSSSGGTITTGTDIGSNVTVMAVNPCDAVGGLAYAIFAKDANNIWLGCGGAGGGLFTSTDGGETFYQVTEANSGATSIDGDNAYYGEGGDASPDVRFYDIKADDDGNILLCGGNNEDELDSKIFLYRVNADDDEYETLVTKDTLLNLGGTGFSDCDNVVAFDNTIVIDDLSGTQIAYSTDSGTTWAKYDPSESVWDMLVVGDTVYASGGTTAAGAEFFELDDDYAGLTSYDVDNNDDTIQDGRALATPDNGATWLVGAAYDTSTDDDGSPINNGVIVRYSTDNGTTWDDAEMGDTSGFSFIRAMACADDTCVAAGDTYPGSQGTGYIIQSIDGGLTWSQVTTTSDLMPLYSVTIYGSTAWFAGDGGYVYKMTL